MPGPGRAEIKKIYCRGLGWAEIGIVFLLPGAGSGFNFFLFPGPVFFIAGAGLGF